MLQAEFPCEVCFPFCIEWTQKGLGQGGQSGPEGRDLGRSCDVPGSGGTCREMEPCAGDPGTS